LAPQTNLKPELKLFRENDSFDWVLAHSSRAFLLKICRLTFGPGPNDAYTGACFSRALRGTPNVDHNAQWSEETDAIGVAGELFVFKVLRGLLGSSFGPDNWTSELRGQADLTYEDINGNLTAFWYLEKVEAWRDHFPMFHIEVKATTGSENEPSHLSRRQMSS
ncbi:hypothetical protein FA95DRAFT_1578894, partial [Auriscalpium vulgare]